MKTIKSLLLKLDTDRLVNTYVYEYPFDYFMLQKKYEKVTLGEINKRYKKKVKEVIERLKKMEIKKVPEDEKMLSSSCGSTFHHLCLHIEIFLILPLIRI